MANSGNLKGMRCPNCGHEAPFIISFRIDLNVYDDGIEYPTPEDNNLYWHVDSYCRCPECDHDGEVWDFINKENQHGDR